MKKRFLRVCSMILIIVLLINMLPMGVFAEAFREAVADAEALKTLTPQSVQVVDEIVERRTEFSKEFLLSSGLHMAVVYPEAVHFETENGWEDIDNTLIAKDDGTLTNTAGVWDVSFPQTLDKNESVTIDKDGYTLSFSMAGELSSTGAMRLTATMDDTVQPLTLEEANPSAVQQKEADVSSLKEAAEYPETVPEKLQSGVTYNEVYEDTHITYDLDSNKVKESVILEAYKDTLQGYRYNLDVGEMIPVLGSDGQITLYDKAKENIVMVMPAPFLQDAAGEYNCDIQVQLEGSGSEYTMTYLLPTRWLAEETRAWPVVLDPVVTPELTTTNIRDITVFENESYWSPSTDKLTNSWGMLQVGYYSTEGKTRTYLKYNNLPELTSSDVVVYASVHMYNADVENTGQLQTNVHKVNGTWTSESITWANKPGYDSNIEDYALVEAEGFYGWTITDIVRDWYATGNTGMLFKAPDSVEAAAVTKYKQFISSDYTDYLPVKPTLQIVFRNNNGLEGYWDYTASSAGRAGTGYVNHFTGNMTWTRTDMGFGGNRAPVTISHVYNLNDVSDPDGSGNNSNNSGGNGFGMGIGWRTNFNQLIYRWNLDSSYYIWEDSDGTDHYFKQENSVYKDEDGLELTLTDTGSGTRKYCIADKDGNHTYFDTQGRLSVIENNQATKSTISVAYNADGRLSAVTDGAGRVYAFTYANGLLSRISYRGTGSRELTYVSFGYSNNRLTTVTDADGKSVTYTYDGNSLMRTASDIDGYKLTYTYNTVSETWQPYRVLTVEEADGTTQGGKLTFAYGHNQTTITDHNGNQSILQFNDFGNLTCIQDDEGKAQFAEYAFHTDDQKNSNTDPTAKGNQLRVSSDLQHTTASLITGGAMRSKADWYTVGLLTKMSITTASSKTDTRSLLVETDIEILDVSEDGEYIYEEEVGVFTWASIPAGATYTFSCYVKPTDLPVWLQAECGSDVVKSEIQPSSTSWQRMELTYTNTSAQEKNIKYSILSDTWGSFYVDCVQLEEGRTATRYNMINNGDFNCGSLTGWTANHCTSADGIATLSTSAAPQLDKTVIKVSGEATAAKTYTQTVYAKGKEGYTYILSGWAKGNAVANTQAEGIHSETAPKREFSINAVFNYSDGTTSDPFVAKLNSDCDLWQYTATAVVAKKDFSSITVTLDYSYNVNTAYFDGIQMFRDEFGDCYTYDNDGKVVSVVDQDSKKYEYEYTANNLTKEIIDGTTEMTYTYDNYHNVITATDKANITYNFTYDTYGNNTAVSVTSGGKTTTSTAVYSSDGNRLVSTTNAMGKVTTYGYNAQTNVLDWVQYPEDTEDTRTEYTYDSMYRMATAACETDTNLALSAAYTYEDDRLTAITTPTTTYSMTYGKFGLRTEVSIGDQTLASYSYTNDRNNYLSSLDYGNGDSVDYTYDDKGRIVSQTYEDGESVSWKYDESGFWTEMTDSATGITTTYTYDLEGRLRLYEEKGVDHDYSLKYSYTDNKLTYVLELIDGYDRGTRYTYDANDRLESVRKAYTQRDYTYDGLNRVTSAVTSHKDEPVLTTSYTFADTETTAGAQVTAIQNVTTGADTPYGKTYSYTYDDNGNILTISDGTKTTSYVYDSANQLIRENNEAGNFTYTWQYDNAGNILSKKVYAYTTENIDDDVIPTDTVTYGYDEDGAWGDLLTSYDGETITYDEIGNPECIDGWSFTWKHGRQLASMSKDGTTWTHTYNADGLRTKRTDGETDYEYVYDGSSLVYMSIDGDPMRFSYAADGTPMSVIYKDSIYFYVTNLQGDVVALVTSLGNTVVEYTYDAWGNIISTAGRMADKLGKANPLRYRGYVYDTETGLYYLQSRYYNPEMGRFINADSVTSTGQGFVGNNMFAYCGNSPASRADIGGYYWETVLDVISLCVSIGDVVGNPDDPMAWLGVVADVASLILPCIAAGGVIVKFLTKADDVVDAAKAIDNIHDTAKVIGNFDDTVDTVKVGWHVGDDITNLTKAGNIPSWTTVRQRYWKNEAYFNPDRYLDDLDRLKKGLAPIGEDGFSMELHHPLGRNGKNFFVFEPLTQSQHRFIHYGD